MVARSGNGAPLLVIGIAAAAASVTTPRMPAQDTTADSRGDSESVAGVGGCRAGAGGRTGR